ncbi:MAG TPA: condensation domain-containing protein, partial [Vicinamibacterales bacterium]|nr:condensation domain-containing protein [Vicinamibacterales bacterium]
MTFNPDDAGLHQPQGLSAAKQALLKQRLSGRSARPSSSDFTIRPRPAAVPVSFAQRDLWFVDRLHRESTQYNLTATLRFRGSFVQAALERALHTLLDRHEILRARFVEQDGEPFQVVDRSATVAIDVISLRDLHPAVARAEVQTARRQARERSFDLSQAPLVRVQILNLSFDEHVLIRTIHHIACDALSERIFDRELRLLYEAFRADRDAALPEQTVQYADFAVWQRDDQHQLSLVRGRRFWTDYLADVPTTLSLPTARPRPPRQTFDGDLCHVTLSREQSDAVRDLNNRHRTTLYMTLLAAFGSLLSRYTGQDDIVVGAPMTTRPAAALENVIGLFVNLLPLRVQVGSNDSFSAVLSRVREGALEAYAHQDVPFSQIVEDLAPERRPDAPPLVQVTFELNSTTSEVGSAEPAGRSVEDHLNILKEIDTGGVPVRFELEVYGWERAGGIGLTWIYNRALFDRPWVEQLARDYVRLLTA